MSKVGYVVTKCHEPKWVKVGKYEVFCTSYKDFETSQLAEVDVLVGLTSEWMNEVVYVPKRFVSLVGSEDKIIVVPMEDSGIDERAVRIVSKLLEAGYRVGIGCFSGHGRTGWIVGRLIMRYEGLVGRKCVEEVRKRLCSEAIESDSQLRDLKVEERELVTLKRGAFSAWSEYLGETFWFRK
jgi:protein-tyrosine phosphatase